MNANIILFFSTKTLFYFFIKNIFLCLINNMFIILCDYFVIILEKVIIFAKYKLISQIIDYEKEIIRGIKSAF